LHVITGLACGGAEQQLRALLPRLPARCEVAVLTDPGVVAEAIRASGVPVHPIGMRGNRDLRALARLTRLMRARRYEVVHTHLYRACLYGRLAARLANVPAIVATEHSIGDRWIEGRRITRPIRALYLAGARLGHATVAVSPDVATRLAAWGVGHVTVIANGVDGAAFAYDPRLRRRTRARMGLPEHAFVVGGVGRLAPGKRFDLLIGAVAQVPGAVALLVGTGPERDGLERLARTLGVAAVFAGETADVRAPLSAMDVLVAPSQEETFGLAVVEALAAGLPVLYGSCPAVSRLPPKAAPGARHVPPGRLGAELRAVAAAPRIRLPPPPAVGLYDISRQAEQLHALYRRLLAPTRKEDHR
jgi:glycosyltransferase involved in cell wall biosynthesis